MATVVEDISVASAKELAASVLYANEKNQLSFYNEKNGEPIVAEYDEPVREKRPSPNFAEYDYVDTSRHTVRTGLSPYEESKEDQNISASSMRVIKPYLDSKEYINQAPIVEMQSTPVAVTSQRIESKIDMDLEEGTQYVVKLKPSTIVVAATVALITVLMLVLFIINALTLASSAAALNNLKQEQIEINQQLNNAIAKEEAIREEIEGSITGNVSIEKIPEGTLVTYVPKSEVATSTNFFDIICKFFSNLFN